MGEIGFHTDRRGLAQTLRFDPLALPERIQERSRSFWERAGTSVQWLHLIGSQLMAVCFLVWGLIIAIGHIMMALIGIAFGLSVFYSVYMFVQWVRHFH